MHRLFWLKGCFSMLYCKLLQFIDKCIVVFFSYKQRAEQLSQIHKDQPEHPVSRTVYWINYVLRYSGAQHLRAAVYNVRFYQYYLLDALLLVTIIIVVAYKIGFLIVSLIANRFSSKLLHSNTNGYCNNGISNGKHRKNGHIKHEKKVK